MTSGNLENLVKTSQLKAERADRKEFDGLVRSGRAHTLGLGAEHWRVLALAHERRNAAEYTGELPTDARLLADMLRVTELVLAKLDEQGPPK